MVLTENRRILLNVCATYSRTLLNVVCGLFSVRWVLMALGQEDFGLYGVVGGLIVFMTFISGLFSNALSRFYAISIGRMKIAQDKVVALDDCRAWFSASMAIQVIIPIVIVAVGYPIGEYGILHGWLAIPLDRIGACVWVWRLACFSAWAGMIVAPIWAMYMAKQNIAEMTIYYMAQTLVRTVFIYCMTLFERDWLVPYAFTLCATDFLVKICYCTQAFVIFPECRLIRRHMFSMSRWKKIMMFSGWQSFAILGHIIKGQGVAVLVNRAFGATTNAAMSIANQLAGEAAALSGALQGAFAPAVTTACGAREYDKMRRLAFGVCRYSTLLMLLFAIPLSLELGEVLLLWLKTPPDYAYGLCLCMMTVLVMEKCSLGHTIAVTAMGQISLYYFLHGLILASAVVVGWLFVASGGSVYTIGYALIITTGAVVVVDVLLARARAGMSVREWLKKVIAPILFVSCPSLLAGLPSLYLFAPSFLRVCCTTICCLGVFLPLAFLSLEDDERNKLKATLVKVVSLAKGTIAK